MTNTKLFFDINKSIMRAANVMFILSLLLLGYGLYNIDPSGEYYDIDAGGSITYTFYQSGTESMEVAVTVVSVYDHVFDIEADYASAILEIKLYFEDVLIYEGVSAAYSADYYNEAGEYRLSIVNVSDGRVEVLMGHGNRDTLALISIVGFAVLISVSIFISVMSLVLIMIVVAVLLIRFIVKQLDEQQNTSKRFIMNTN